MSDIGVFALNRRARVAVLDDGRSAEITNFFDELGDDCEPDDAAVCIVKISNDRWVVVRVEDFDGMAN